jgi:transposase-like protein
MDPLQAAIEDIENLEPGEHFSYTKVATKHGVVRSTLTRRHQGQTSSRNDKKLNQRKLNVQQELELVRYIEKLTKRGLPPTREMIRNFSSEVAHQQLSESWVTRFINRHKIYLISKWTTAMDRTRH